MPGRFLQAHRQKCVKEKKKNDEWQRLTAVLTEREVRQTEHQAEVYSENDE